MPLSKVVTAIAIHLLVPLAGVVAFGVLCRRMEQARIPSPPYLSWFVLFGSFGGWLLVVLTAMFWEWSGMASIGFVSLVLVAPLVTAVMAVYLRPRKTLSAFHRHAFTASAVYSGMMLLLVMSWLIAVVFLRDGG